MYLGKKKDFSLSSRKIATRRKRRSNNVSTLFPSLKKENNLFFVIYVLFQFFSDNEIHNVHT